MAEHEEPTLDGAAANEMLDQKSLPAAARPRKPQAPPPTPPKPVVQYEPASFPKGFWPCIDYLIHHPEEVFESLKRDKDLWQLARIFFTISFAMAALYGAIMGATNLLQSSPMTTSYKLLLVLIVGIKTPVLFLLTLLIVIPPIYVSNAFIGTRYSFRQVLALLLATTAITTTVLASMATVSFFFSLTSQNYHFVKLLHVFFFAYAGVMGLAFMKKCLSRIGTDENRRTPRKILILWLLLYIFVGTQLAWVLRPFVGSPGEPFQVFRPRSGNFYESIIDSVSHLERR